MPQPISLLSAQTTCMEREREREGGGGGGGEGGVTEGKKIVLDFA